MYLKRIELVGFKSFAGRSATDLPPGIVVVVGPNGSGKCLTRDALVTLADGRDVPIGDLVEAALRGSSAVEQLDDGLLTPENPHAVQVLSLRPDTLRLEARPVAAFVKRTAPPSLLRVRTRSGREITATPYHPLFTLERGHLRTLRADELQVGTRVAVPRRLSVLGSDPPLPLRSLPPASNPNFDLVPGATTLVRDAAQLAGIQLKKHRVGRPKLAAYVEQRCEASRGGLLQVAGQIETLGATRERAAEPLQRLRVLATSDVYWDEIVSIEHVAPADPWVYDLSVAETHNFVANNVVVHNSNVADAVRWVLGEQSAKAVRARRPEEVIFAGSAGRQPLGMAEVSLILDNADGAVPLAFEELKVTRRLYRSGDSEYLLNNARVRLKDVTDHLLHARLGPDSYSVIGQGAVDELILQRPEERRTAFENAADIRRHGLKLHETRGKLAATEANLVRVRDVIAELEPHVRRLKSQADRASRADRVRAELEVVSLGYYRQRLLDVRAESGATQRALQAATAELQAAEAETAREAGSVQAAEQRLAELDERLALLRPRVAAQREQARVAERSLAVTRERSAASAEQRQRLEHEIGAAEQRIGRLEAEAVALRQELEEAAEAPGVEAEQAAQARRELAPLEARLAELGRAAQAARARRDEAERRIVAAETAAERAEQRLRQIEASAAVDTARGAEWRARVAQLEAAAERGSTELGTLAPRLDALRAASTAADAIRGVAERRLAQAREQVREAAQRAARLRGSLEALGAWSADAAAPLELSARLEPAWAAVLDGLPVLGTAAELSTRIKPLDSLLRGYLGRVVVVRDDQAAREAHRRLASALDPAAAAWAVLSLEGLLLAAPDERPIEARAGAGSALADWRQRVAELEADAGRAAAEREAAEREQAEATEALRLAEAQRGEARATLRDLETHRQQLQRAQTAAADELAGVQGALQRAEREQQAAAAERSAAEQAAARGRTEREAARAERQAAQEALSDLEGRLMAAREAATEARRRLAELEAGHRQRAAERAGRAALAARVAADLRAAVDGRDAAAQRLAVLTGQLQDLDERGSQLAEEVRAAEVSLRPLETSLATMETERAALLAERRQLEERAQACRLAERAPRERREAALVQAQRARDEQERIEREVAEAADPEAGDDPSTGGWARQLALDLDSTPGAASAPAEVVDVAALRRRMVALQRDLRLLGGASGTVLQEYHELADRHGFLVQQAADLQAAMGELRAAAEELEEHMRGRFATAFASVNDAFQDCFQALFGGGEARLVLTRPEDLLGTGVDIVARPPGKKLQGLLSLSGGERALTVVALLFGLLKVNPTPFCVLDEVDAALDEANVQRFAGLLRELARTIQFVVVTHNRATMEMADALYGVTMDSQGVSKILSVQPREVARGNARATTTGATAVVG